MDDQHHHHHHQLNSFISPPLYPPAAAAASVYSHLLLPNQQAGASDHQYSEGGKPVVEKRRRRKKKRDQQGGEENQGILRKRKLTDEQVTMLELNFGHEHKLESERKDRLASELGLDPRQVAVWFQNRRARWKTKKLEEEYSKLKSSHDLITLDKCRLESEVMTLKEQLAEAEKEIRRLSLTADVGSSNSPSSSLTMEAVDPHQQPPFLGGFGVVEEYEDVFYSMPESAYAVNGMEWVYM